MSRETTEDRAKRFVEAVKLGLSIYFHGKAASPKDSLDSANKGMTILGGAHEVCRKIPRRYDPEEAAIEFLEWHLDPLQGKRSAVMPQWMVDSEPFSEKDK